MCSTVLTPTSVDNIGREMHDFCRSLFPVCRSITGNGLRESLLAVKQILADLNIVEVPTGTRCFDWVVPKEWNIRDAYIVTPSGEKICDFKKNNLHVVGYSIPVNKRIALGELQTHLHSRPDMPKAIPYVTSYYQERWGFCLTEEKRLQLVPGEYEVRIDSELKIGSLTYGELLVPGQSTQEVFFSTYLCHPSMANNELSGPAVVAHLARWIQSLPNRHYTYRFVFIPETIGSICYLSRNLDRLRKYVVAGYNVTCVGDDRAYSFLPTPEGNTLSDEVARHVLGHTHPEYIVYENADRESDERQYGSPGVDLPVCSIMRSKYRAYPEYHTSLDNLELVTPSGLFGAYDVYQKCVECLEMNPILKSTVVCEPQLGRRGLYPTLSDGKHYDQIKIMRNLIGYANGRRSLLAIAGKLKIPLWQIQPVARRLMDEGLLGEIRETITE